jgi:hypothetical protein
MRAAECFPKRAFGVGQNGYLPIRRVDLLRLRSS